MDMQGSCASCGQPLEASVRGNDRPITHGICEQCAETTNTDRKTLRALLDSVPAAVMTVDPEGRVRAANAHACQALGKPAKGVIDLLGGDAMECAYASLPQGCGKTEHCAACAIRNTVMGTLESGRSTDHVPACQQIRMADGVMTVHFTISTEKLGDLVLLRVDAASPEGPAPAQS